MILRGHHDRLMATGDDIQILTLNHRYHADQYWLPLNSIFSFREELEEVNFTMAEAHQKKEIEKRLHRDHFSIPEAARVLYRPMPNQYLLPMGGEIPSEFYGNLCQFNFPGFDLDENGKVYKMRLRRTKSYCRRWLRKNTSGIYSVGKDHVVFQYRDDIPLAQIAGII